LKRFCRRPLVTFDLQAPARMVRPKYIC
jgi:hypothetical protein